MSAIDAVCACWTVLGEELVGAAPSEENLDIRIARGPWVVQHVAAAAIEHLGAMVTHEVECLAQRRSPRLVPTWCAARVAAAVLHPTTHAMGARPGTLVHAHLSDRRNLVDELRRVDHPNPRGVRLVTERVCECAVGELVMMSEGLAVGGDAHRRAVFGSDDDAPDQLLAGQAGEPEGEVVRNGAVVEDDGDRPSTAVRMHPSIRLAPVDRAARLPRRKDREPDALLDEDPQHIVVDCSLRKPHTARRTAEAVLEIGQPPADLRPDITLVGERQDHVVVGLRDGATPDSVGFEHALVHLGVVDLEPGQQRRTDVERQMLVVVDDLGHTTVLVEDTRPPVGPVALGGDAFVPVVERGGRRLHRDVFGPRVLPRRLVEVPVDDQPHLTHRARGYGTPSRTNVGWKRAL